ECDKAQSGKSSDFGEAVSQLAALAAAGKDVAALTGVDVRAFTGEAKFRRKAAAGSIRRRTDGCWGAGLGAVESNCSYKALVQSTHNQTTGKRGGGGGRGGGG
ncbi:conjugal transfer protein TraN, partial [Escherichia coli]|uniref:conjugal transfer protein TraN n=1 Tax=Escherichia coli TaxID=562 RepID=UPI0020259AFC